MRIRGIDWALLSLVVGLAACSSDDSESGTASSCAENPLSCGADKTCWVVDKDGKYDCIAATTDKPEGANCQNLVGQAQCNAGLMCFPAVSGTADGTCQPFCTQAKTCVNGSQCAGVTLINAPGAATVYACVPMGTGGTGGTGGMGGAAGSGGSTGGAAGSGGSTGGAAGSGGSTGGAAGTGGTMDGGAGDASTD